MDGLGMVKAWCSYSLSACLYWPAGAKGRTPETRLMTRWRKWPKKNLDRYKQIKDDLGEIQKQQTEKYKQLDEDTDDK